MVEEYNSIIYILIGFLWLFFVIFAIIKFFVYLLSNIEFKRRLNMIKYQLFNDIKDTDYLWIEKFLSIDDLYKIQFDTQKRLITLKKDIFSYLSKFDVNKLDMLLLKNYNYSNKGIDQTVLLKYRDAIKSLNKKIVYTKNELDVIKKSFVDIHYDYDKKINNQQKDYKSNISSYVNQISLQLSDKVENLANNFDKKISDHISFIDKLQQKNDIFVKDNLSKVYEIIGDKDVLLEDKQNYILEQKDKLLELEKRLFSHNDFIENKLKHFSMDKDYLDQYLSKFKSMIKWQNNFNIVFVVAIVLLFVSNLFLLFFLI